MLRWPKARRLVLIDEQYAFATHLVELGEPVIIGVKGVDPVLMHDVVGDGLSGTVFGRALGVRIIRPVAFSVS